jgi:hypothetical protein
VFYVEHKTLNSAIGLVVDAAEQARITGLSHLGVELDTIAYRLRAILQTPLNQLARAEKELVTVHQPCKKAIGPISVDLKCVLCNRVPRCGCDWAAQ